MKSPSTRSIFLASLLLFSATAPRALTAQQTGQQTAQSTAQPTANDPFIWLEDVDGKRSMDWVNAHNASTVAVLGATPLYQSIYDRTKPILDSKDRIAYPRIVGDMLSQLLAGRRSQNSGSGGARAGAITRPAIRSG